MSAVEISVIVPAFNEALELPNLLKSLECLQKATRVEVVVVDNGSTDQTSDVAKDAQVRVIRISRSPVGRGRNEGAKIARGRVLAFLDADIVVTSEWVESISNLAAERRWGGIVTGDVYDVVQSPSWIERFWFGAMYRRGVNRYINGGNLIIGRDDFFRTGGFDAKMTSGEDVDFCERCRAIGLEVVPDRAFHVLHAGYPSSILQFVGREAWHGRGDFSSLRSLRRSPVAVLAIFFFLAHACFAWFLMVGKWTSSLVTLAAIAGLCLGCSWLKWSNEPVRARLVNAAIFYLYFIGRSAAAFHELRARYAGR